MNVEEGRRRYVRWLQTTKGCSEHTLRAYSGDIAALGRYLGAAENVSAINAERLLSFIDDQLSSGLSGTSVKRRVSAIRGFCTWLARADLLQEDPWPALSVTLGRTRKLPRVVPADDLVRLLTHLCFRAGLEGECVRRLRRPYEATTLLAVVLLLTTGVRVGELGGVNSDDVDLSTATLRLLGKGKRERQVFLTSEWMINLVGAYLRLRRELGVIHAPLLFNRHRLPLAAAAIRQRLRGAAAEAGLRSRVTPHMLRHTAATQLIEAGVDIRYIQRLLGHASLTTTEIYTHVSDAALRQAVSDAGVLERLMKR